MGIDIKNDRVAYIIYSHSDPKGPLFMAVKTAADSKPGKAAKILRCNCSHEYQDKVFGAGRRSHNLTKDKQYRCTVCKTKRGD